MLYNKCMNWNKGLAIFTLVVFSWLSGYFIGYKISFEKSLKNYQFYWGLDRQSSYECCVTFSVVDGKIIEQIDGYNGYSRVLFNNALNVKEVFLGPDYKTLHFVTSDFKNENEFNTIIFNVKSFLSNSDKFLSNKPKEDLTPPWDFQSIVYNSSSINGNVPRITNSNSLIEFEGNYYILYVSTQGLLNKRLNLFNVQTNKIDKSFLIVNEDLSKEDKISDGDQPDLESTYPSHILVLKDYYLIQLSNHLVLLDKSNLEMLVNRPFDDEFCPQAVLSSDKSNVILTGNLICMGGSNIKLIDFSDKAVFNLNIEVRISRISELKTNFENDQVKITNNNVAYIYNIKNKELVKQ